MLIERAGWKNIPDNLRVSPDLATYVWDLLPNRGTIEWQLYSPLLRLFNTDGGQYGFLSVANNLTSTVGQEYFISGTPSSGKTTWRLAHAAIVTERSKSLHERKPQIPIHYTAHWTLDRFLSKMADRFGVRPKNWGESEWKMANEQMPEDISKFRTSPYLRNLRQAGFAVDIYYEIPFSGKGMIGEQAIAYAADLCRDQYEKFGFSTINFNYILGEKRIHQLGINIRSAAARRMDQGFSEENYNIPTLEQELAAMSPSVRLLSNLRTEHSRNTLLWQNLIKAAPRKIIEAHDTEEENLARESYYGGGKTDKAVFNSVVIPNDIVKHYSTNDPNEITKIRAIAVRRKQLYRDLQIPDSNFAVCINGYKPSDFSSSKSISDKVVFIRLDPPLKQG